MENGSACVEHGAAKQWWALRTAGKKCQHRVFSPVEFECLRRLHSAQAGRQRQQAGVQAVQGPCKLLCRRWQRCSKHRRPHPQCQRSRAACRIGAACGFVSSAAAVAPPSCAAWSRASPHRAQCGSCPPCSLRSKRSTAERHVRSTREQCSAPHAGARQHPHSRQMQACGAWPPAAAAASFRLLLLQEHDCCCCCCQFCKTSSPMKAVRWGGLEASSLGKDFTLPFPRRQRFLGRKPRLPWLQVVLVGFGADIAHSRPPETKKSSAHCSHAKTQARQTHKLPSEPLLPRGRRRRRPPSRRRQHWAHSTLTGGARTAHREGVGVTRVSNTAF